MAFRALARAVALGWVFVGCSTAVPPVVANADCGGCHPTEYVALQGSRHAHATESALFTALRARASARDQAFCDNCHGAHDVAGERGAGCVTCHTAVGNRGVQNAALVYDPSGGVQGPFGSSVPTPAHASHATGFVTSADLCGTCHEVAGPGAFQETPYTEWAASPAATAGVSCAACHMATVPGDALSPPAVGAAATGGPLRALSDHAFVGPDDPRASELLSHAAAVAIQVQSITQDTVTVAVTVTNRNAAHALPSGARFAREVWLELTAVDTLGGMHGVSGDTDVRDLPVSGDVQRVDLGDRVTHGGVAALPMDSDPPTVRAIPAAGRAVFPFVLPRGWTPGGPTVTVRVRLRYRRNTAALRQALGLGADSTPPVDLATAAIPVTVP